MGTSLHTFADIFESEVVSNGRTYRINEIVIPKIQRDYAQGRDDDRINRVRSRFLDTLYKAVTEQPIALDFIYGDITENGELTPLDGQQRLTTLYLLHWYAAKRGAVSISEYEFLKRFSYETRYSARNFCSNLVDFTPSFTEQLSKEIIDQYWFPLQWQKDPTISSMLVMLDAIDEKFNGVPDLWGKLIGGAIGFYFLSIPDMGLTDDLYIKMNSRGKPLTPFEHFKAEFEQTIKAVDEDLSNRILSEIDREWTDMLWEYREEDGIIDDKFLRYFRFICDVLCYKADGTPQGKSSDELSLLQEHFSVENANAKANIETLEQFFNCWRDLPEGSPHAFLSKFFSHDHEQGKIRIDRSDEKDIFKDCLQNYADMINARNRQFPLRRIVLLYAVTVYLQNRDTIDEPDFRKRLRVVNNLIQNSVYEISDSENRQGGNRMPAILEQVDSIIITGTIVDFEKNNFNRDQIDEEIAKYHWRESHPDYDESLSALEDHPLLAGQIGIIGLDSPQLFSRFTSLFSCNWDLVDCALLVTIPHYQKDRNGWRYQLGSSGTQSAWQNLFHHSLSSGYDATSKSLKNLLAMEDQFTDEFLSNIVSGYIRAAESTQHFDWRYYYVKYASFRPGRYGKYSWDDLEEKPYEMVVLLTDKSYSENTRQPFLFEIDPEHIDRDKYGLRLKYSNYYVVCEQDAYVAKAYDGDEVISRYPIPQYQDGIDSQDRILLGKEALEQFAGLAVGLD